MENPAEPISEQLHPLPLPPNMSQFFTPSFSNDDMEAPRETVAIIGFFQNAWTVCTKPSVASFDATRNSATWGNIAWAFVLLGTLNGIARMTHSGPHITLITAGIFYYFLVFPLVTGMFYWVGKAFGGRGLILDYGNALVLANAPIVLGAALLSWIPGLGTLLVLGLAGYECYLWVLATRSRLHLSTKRAVATVGIPFLFLVFLIILFSFLAYA